MAKLFFKDPASNDMVLEDARIRILLADPHRSDADNVEVTMVFETSEDNTRAAVMVGMDEMFQYMHLIADADHTAKAAYETERDNKDCLRPPTAVDVMRLQLDQMEALAARVRALMDAYDREIPKLKAWIGEEEAAVPAYVAAAKKTDL